MAPHSAESVPSSGGIRQKTTMERLPSLLTVDEAATFFRINRKTLYEAIRLNQVPGTVRFGKTIRIGRDALIQWLRGNGGPALGGKR